MEVCFVKGKKVILSKSWLFLNRKENKGQNNMGTESFRTFVKKKHLEKFCT